MREAIRISLLLVFTFTSLGSHAQQFDWVHGGGGLDPLADPQNVEATYYMCTDANKNVYALNQVGNTDITADTFHVASAYNNEQNLLITSYNCNGQMRWSKLIASNTGNGCRPNGVVADSLGHIYVAGYVTNNTLHIGTSITITGLTHEHLALMQFDTLGNYNWIQYVGDNNQPLGSVAANNNVLVMGINNTPHYLCYMISGITLAPGVVSHCGVYDMLYNASGTLLSATRLEVDSSWALTSVAIDRETNKLFVVGQRNIYLQGGNPNFMCFAADFDANRNRIWMDTLSNSYSALQNVIYDKMGHLYFNGSSNLTTFSFNGISGPNGNVGVVMKTDTAGNPIWLRAKTINANGTNGSMAITLLPNNLIAETGYFGTTLTDGVHSITCPQAGNNPFLSILDTSGVPMSLVQIYGDGYYDWSRCITSDWVGNVYVGGQVEDSIFATNPSIPAYHTNGGNTDFFVMKYGMDCGCNSMPVANFSNTVSQFTSNFIYNGTMAGIDSLTWNFGDGSTANGNTASHTYPAVPQGQSVNYEVCVTAYTGCGNDMHCSQVRIDGPVSVANVSNEDGVQVYPNPTNDELKIVTKDYSNYKLLNLTGAIIQTGNIQQGSAVVSMSGLSSGMYLLELKQTTGQTKTIKVVKE